MFWLGLDVGSISLKTLVLGEAGEILFEDYRRTHGRPYRHAAEVLESLDGRFRPDRISGVAVTGTGGSLLAGLLGGRFVNEIVALSIGLQSVDTSVRTAVEMGGQDSKLLLFEGGGGGGRRILSDFSTNSLCAAGTGSFLDQQATRLGVPIEEEFAKLALRSEAPPRIAGRCSVFAKSDMIHLQQAAAPVHDIAAGLCLALARGFKSTVGKGKAFVRPVAFVGGVASNLGMVRAFEAVLGMGHGELVIPAHHRTLCALGAALLLAEEGCRTEYRGAEALRSRGEGRAEPRKSLQRLVSPAGREDGGAGDRPPDRGAGERIDAYVGVDIGSISTNVVVLDGENRVLAKRYLSTAGRPIEAVQEGLRSVGEEIGDGIRVLGAATTGSGRYLIGELIGADVIRNEITAQATAAVMLDPAVDTIFEIGGQDSKFISVEGGVVCDFEMNKACAAGTGSFLEEQAERLNIDLKTEFAALALEAESPVALGDRCTVFMESDLVHHQQMGAGTPELLAGLAYSIVHNYLNRVVGDRRVGKRVFFQGGTAFNKAVVAAFNRVLGREVIVPPHHEVTGAIGAAMLAREKSSGTSKFRGFDLEKLNFEVNSFVCKSCPNMCEIRMVKGNGLKPVYCGGRCEKYEVDRHASPGSDLPDLFGEYLELLEGPDGPAGPRGAGARTVGIPRSLTFFEFLPFWRTFFEALGFEVVLSEPTRKPTIRKGVECVVSETCFPVKVAHGHILDLLELKPDLIFLPSLIDARTEEFGEKDGTVFNCPLVQTIPYTARCSIDFDAAGVPVLSPALHMQLGLEHLASELARHRRLLGRGKRAIREALARAEERQAAFRKALERRGREILEGLEDRSTALVVVSRPYNGCDPGINLDLAKKIRSLGILPIPMEMLPLSEVSLPERWRRVYWRYGQRILKAAEIIKGDPRLFGVYVTNFSCGPDSFLLHFFQHEMSGKPFLQLEIDEHSADAGLITRCEAFLDTLENLPREGGRRVARARPPRPGDAAGDRRIYLPNMSPHAFPLAAAMRAMGTDAVVMEISDETSVYWGERYTTGRECYPALLTVGDIVRQTKRKDFDPERSAFFMATADGPCRFGQYSRLHRFVLDELGHRNVPVFTLDQDRGYHESLARLGGGEFQRLAWRGIVATDILERLLLETRPYELIPDTAGDWFERSLERVSRALEANDGTFWEILPEIARDHRSIRRSDVDGRPLIGVVGEVYVRANTFANGRLVDVVENLGGRALMPPLGEWFKYVNCMRVRKDRRRGDRKRMLRDLGIYWFSNREESRIFKAFGRRPDPGPTEQFRLASPYIHESFEGESILTIAKAVEMIRHDRVSGILNTMPFTCMPGTICSALFKRVREDHGNVPILNLVFTGQQSMDRRLQLEAFIHQARQFAGREHDPGVPTPR